MYSFHSAWSINDRTKPPVKWDKGKETLSEFITDECAVPKLRFSSAHPSLLKKFTEQVERGLPFLKHAMGAQPTQLYQNNVLKPATRE